MSNWKTTLLGLLTAILNVLLPALSSGSVEPKDMAVSAGIAALGYFAKDSNVTGGTTIQPGV